MCFQQLRHDSEQGFQLRGETRIYGFPTIDQQSVICHVAESFHPIIAILVSLLIIYDFFIIVGIPAWLTDGWRKRGPKEVTQEGSKAKRCFDSHTGTLKPGVRKSLRVLRVSPVALPALQTPGCG